MFEYATEDPFDKGPVLAVPPVRAIAKKGVIAAPLLPEPLKLGRVCLPVRISLENVAGTLVERITVTKYEGRPMATIRFIERYEKWVRLLLTLEYLVSVVFGSVVDND